MTKSRVLKKLRAGELVVAAGVNRTADPWIGELLGKIGHDVIWFDMEHRAFNYNQLDALSLACRSGQLDLMVRVLKEGYMSPMRALEFGANGLMVPHCRSVEEARQWAEWVRFPPLGNRGFDGAGADADYALADPLEYVKHANEEVFLAVQIEDPEAVECVEEIAAVPGVDLLFVGPTDLTLSYGIPMEFEHPLMKSAIQRVAAAARKAGKWWGIPTGSAADAQAMVNQGARMITAGNDHGILMSGYKRAFENMRQVTVD